MHGFHNLSKIIQPVSHGELKQKFTSKSHKLFVELGISYFNSGIGTMLPFIVRPLRKLEALVRQKMDEVSALEVILPTLIQATLLEKSKKIDLPELYRLNDRHKKAYILSPTNEEEVANLMSSIDLLSEPKLPCRMYQISKKFRDEKRIKHGFLRSKEFIMKDLYCFESSEENNKNCYKEVVNKYHELFQFINVPYACVKGLPGSIGGSMSHEFHFISDAGEDKIISCNNCSYGENLNCFEEEKVIEVCPKCQSKNIEVMRGIEVGHTFNLDTIYTKIFNAKFHNNEGKQELLHMSCFGLGLTRILAAAVEVLCSSEEIRWPISLAPYLICIIPPKNGSKEEIASKNTIQQVYQHIKEEWKNDVIVDDRTERTIGFRFVEAKKIGFPFVVVIGKTITQQPPLIEVHDLYSNSVDKVQISNINQLIKTKYQSHINNKQREFCKDAVLVNV